MTKHHQTSGLAFYALQFTYLDRRLATKGNVETQECLSDPAPVAADSSDLNLEISLNSKKTTRTLPGFLRPI